MGDIEHSTVRATLAAHPDATLATRSLLGDELETAQRWSNNYRSPNPAWSEGLLGTIAVEDNRRPRFDMGLGLWTENLARYYPVLTLNNANNAIVDTVDGRNVVVYFDETTGLPSVFYTEAKSAQWYPHELRLDDGSVYRDGLLYTRDGKTAPPRPHFQVIRWYGFAYLFPNCDIYTG